MLRSEEEFLGFMEEHAFRYEYLAHPAVFTCEEAAQHHVAVEAVSTKNLFLCDKKKRHFFLVVTDCEKVLRLKELSERLGVSKLRFGSEVHLDQMLGVGRGAVTMMALANDSEKRVALWIDEEIWGGEYCLCHPLVNRSTLVLSKGELVRFFGLTGHEVRFF